MKISKNIENKALQTLRFEGVSGLPKEIENTGFYVALHDDRGFLAHGVIEFEGVEYKIGTKK